LPVRKTPDGAGIYIQINDRTAAVPTIKLVGENTVKGKVIDGGTVSAAIYIGDASNMRNPVPGSVSIDVTDGSLEASCVEEASASAYAARSVAAGRYGIVAETIEIKSTSGSGTATFIGGTQASNMIPVIDEYQGARYKVSESAEGSDSKVLDELNDVLTYKFMSIGLFNETQQPAPVPLIPQVNVPVQRLPEYIEAEEVEEPETLPGEMVEEEPVDGDVEEPTADEAIPEDAPAIEEPVVDEPAEDVPATGDAAASALALAGILAAAAIAALRKLRA